MEKTALEFLLEKYKSQNTLLFAEDFEQAKEMEKKQIKDAFDYGLLCEPSWEDEAEEYYNETFKSE